MNGLAYNLAADAVVVVHFGWILFLIGGSAVGRRARWAMWLHIGALGYSLFLQIFSWICPLTYLEVWFRSRGNGDRNYSGSFIAHYLERLIYYQIGPEWILFLTGIVIGISAAVYYRTIGPAPHH